MTLKEKFKQWLDQKGKRFDPEEKAEELVDKFARIDGYQDSIDLSKCEYEKKCALIAVEEILKLELNDGYDHNYWKQVKQEIKKL